MQDPLLGGQDPLLGGQAAGRTQRYSLCPANPAIGPHNRPVLAPIGGQLKSMQDRVKLSALECAYPPQAHPGPDPPPGADRLPQHASHRLGVWVYGCITEKSEVTSRGSWGQGGPWSEHALGDHRKSQRRKKGFRQFVRKHCRRTKHCLVCPPMGS